ncbi:sialidase family protein [Streptomyces malaysiense]|uniref:exo-alpha-sialidase n=1 Tax=Streptomyces malaysiense TaxID=1428626 RepID=A0A1J4PZ78_9ACTN|nr:sialidase family protein [Streptomyces malaysiense]OIK25588.1 alpha-sialidase [Streptomyces malaysiense]
MTPLRRTVLTGLTLLAALASAALPAAAGPLGSAPGCASSRPYVSGQGGYAAYRVPALVRTLRGTVLAFAEGRRAGFGDSGDIDVVVRRSTDGGCTWGPLAVVAAGDGNTRGNPAPAVDPRTGAIILVTCGNAGGVTEDQIMRGQVAADRGRRVYVQRGSDDGRTFTAPQDITADVERPGWRWYATGPGHAVALTRGPHAGRILVPADHSTAPPKGSKDTGRESRHYAGHALYSDDGGRTWHLGFTATGPSGVVDVNETSATQLPDGRIYFSARDQYGSAPGNRLDSYSSDGGATLDRPFAAQRTLKDVPVVQGSVLQLRGAGAPLLFSAPSVPTARRAMAVWSSTDAGRGFTRLTTLDDGRAAYSDLVQLGPGTVGVLYETGSYDGLSFRRLTGIGDGTAAGTPSHG